MLSTLEDAFVKTQLRYSIKKRRAKVREYEEVIFKTLGPEFTYQYLEEKDMLYNLETAQMYTYITELAKVLLETDMI